MKKINNNIKFIYLFIICFLFIKLLSFINLIPMITNIIPVIWFIIFIIGIFITHNDYNHFFDVKDKVQTIIILIIIYLIIHFSLGLVFGYSYNIYDNTKIDYIIKNIYMYILPIIFQEYVRGILCNYSNNSSKIRCIISIIYVLTNLTFVNFNSIFVSGESLLKFLCFNLIPLISCEFVLTYITSIASYKTSLMYKIMMMSYSIFVPIVPNLNFFLHGIINTVFPAIIYFVFDSIHEMDVYKIYRYNCKRSILNYIPTIIILSIIVLNFFGIFKYQMVAILSNSMQPLYSKGDAIVYERISEQEKKLLKVGDIIVFYDKNNNLIIHRIYKIRENKGENEFITKGDNNDSVDSNVVKTENIKGKYLFNIKYIGYPKMYMYEILNN